MKRIYTRTINSNMIKLFQVIFFNVVFTIGHNGSGSNGKIGYISDIKQRSKTAL